MDLKFHFLMKNSFDQISFWSLILFSTVKLKLGLKFYQFIHRFKLGSLHVAVRLVYVLGCTFLCPSHKEIEPQDISILFHATLPNSSQNMKAIYRIFWFSNFGQMLYFQNFPNSLKRCKTGISYIFIYVFLCISKE